MPRAFSYVFGVLIAALLVGGPLGYAYHQQGQIRHFRVVREGVLYRSAQLSLAGLKRVIHDYGIRTVITLREAHFAGDPPPDRAEEKYCVAEDIRYVRIPPQRWWSQDGSVPAEMGVRQFLEIMDEPANYPVLVHCFAGIHRTGAYCAIYRMEYEHWTNAEAITEMKACGYSTLDDELDVLGYVEHYRARWQGRPPANEAALPLREGLLRSSEPYRQSVPPPELPDQWTDAAGLLGGQPAATPRHVPSAQGRPVPR